MSRDRKRASSTRRSAADPSSAGPSLRSTLRTSTAEDHRAIDRTLSHLDLADAPPYRRFRHIQLAALKALSAPWGTNDREDLESLIGCLHEDLAIEYPSHTGVCDPIATNTPFHDAGIANVVRGSRLGAGVLLQRVRPGLPTRYLSHRPTLSGSQFLARLTALDEGAGVEAIEQSIASARSAFGAFTRAAAAGSPA